MYPIRRQALFAAIGLDPNAKIPADFSAEFIGVHVKDYSNIEHIFNVRIIPTRMNSWKGRPIGTGKHRVFLFCNMCRHWIPFGRIAQHYNRRDHY